MGTGKTVVGKQLARILKTKFVDVDKLIEQKQGKKISRIFKEKGEEYFRNCEYEIIKEVSGLNNHIISPGGGAILEFENVLNLKKNGIIVCLTATPEIIWERIKKNKNRPLLKVKDPLKKIKTLLRFRQSYYKQANIFVETSNLDIKQTAIKILQEIVKYNR